MAADAIISIDSHGQIDFWNRAAEGMFGYSAEAAVGRSLEIIIPDRLREIHRKGMERVVSGGKACVHGKTVELVGLKSNGSEFPLELSLASWYSGEETYFTGIVRDITERKQTEKALRESEEEKQAILDNSTTVVYLKDVEGGYLFINSRYEELHHVSRDEIIGKTDHDIFPFQVADLLRINGRAVMDRGEVVEFEEKVPQPDGEMRIYISVKFPLRNSEGTIYGVCGISTDITDRKRQEQSLLQSSRLIALGEMAAGLAHELNQPLTVISTLADGLQVRLEGGVEISTERLVQWSQDTLAAVDRMSALIEHLRVFSRDRSEEPKEAVALNDVVTSTLAMTGAQLRSGRIEVNLDLAEDLPSVLADPFRLEQVILNLISNARDALEEKRDQMSDSDCSDWVMSLVVRTRQEDDDVLVEVEDNGSGMDEETRQRLFEPFFTTKGPDRGTGLGLSIAHAIVKDHEGEIECKSQGPEGTVFRFRLPVQRCPPIRLRSGHPLRDGLRIRNA